MADQRSKTEHLRRLLRLSVEAVARSLTEEGHWPRPVAARRLRLGQELYYNKFKDLAEVKEVIEFLAEDQKFLSIYGKDPNTVYWDTCYRIWQKFLRSALVDIDGTHVDEERLGSSFAMFHRELYRPSATWRALNIFSGVSMSPSEIPLDRCSKLVQFDAFDIAPLIGDQQVEFSGDWPGGDKVALVTTVRVKKRDYMVHSDRPYPHQLDDFQRSLALLEALRLLKPGCPRVHCHVSVQLSEFPLSEPFAYCNSYRFSQTFEIESFIKQSDSPRLKRLWLQFVTEYKEDAGRRLNDPNRSDVARQRFSTSFDSWGWLTPITDLTIALEALFQPKDNDKELNHRIALRAAWLLGSTEEESIRIYDRVQTMYKIRSSQVHGNIPSPTKRAKWIRSLVDPSQTPGEGELKEQLIAVEAARQVVRDAILACMKLSSSRASGAPHWPLPPDFDKLMLSERNRRAWRKAASLKARR